ncbi:hypothetical protein SKC41_02275 [Mycobacterium sp. 050128]|uniref:hypothetical protein n=1 Tax=Mycobacterium sp. 050128 TaxID=3096112 RepID=UPI002ED820FB
MKTIIHVNQHKVRAKHPAPLTVKTYKSNSEANHIDIVVDGRVVATVKYQPDKPLSCGARVWIETQARVVVHAPNQEEALDGG